MNTSFKVRNYQPRLEPTRPRMFLNRNLNERDMKLILPLFLAATACKNADGEPNTGKVIFVAFVVVLMLTALLTGLSEGIK